MPAVQCSTALRAITRQLVQAYMTAIETRRPVKLRREERAGRKAAGRTGRKTMLLWAFLVKRYREWKAYRATYNALADLDVRARADIGVTWNEINTIARRAALKAGTA